MRPGYYDKILDELDAGVFTGDSFHDKKERVKLLKYCRRWVTELISLQMNSIEECENCDAKGLDKNGEDCEYCGLKKFNEVKKVLHEHLEHLEHTS